MSNIPHGFIAISAATRILGVTERHVFRLVDNGTLESVKIGWRRYVSRDSVMAYARVKHQRRIRNS